MNKKYIVEYAKLHYYLCECIDQLEYGHEMESIQYWKERGDRYRDRIEKTEARIEQLEILLDIQQEAEDYIDSEE